MLQLCDSELQLLELGSRDEAELLEQPFEARAGPLAHAHRFAAPAVGRLLDQLARLVAAHASLGGELVCERIRSLCRQRGRA